MNTKVYCVMALATALGLCEWGIGAERSPAEDAGVRWPGRRAELEKEWLKLLGPFPTAKPPLDAVALSTETVKLEAAQMDPCAPRGGSKEITRWKVKFRSEAEASGGSKSDLWIFGWLLAPKSALERWEKEGKKTPAIICLHSTTYGAGKSSPAGLAGRYVSDPRLGFVGRPDLAGKDTRYQNNLPDLSDPEAAARYWAGGRAAGLILAQHGFVTLSIDFDGDGERVEPGQRPDDSREFYRRYPDLQAEQAWSVIGKCVWDVMRAVDYLETVPYVNAKGIGCTGWSYGGHVTLFAAALDQRIAAAVPNGGVLDWHRPAYPAGYRGKPKANAWARTPSTMEPWTADGKEPASSGAETLRRWGFLQNSGPVIYIPKFFKYTLPENRDLPVPVDFDSLMMMVAPRPLLIISSEIEFKQHQILPKAMEALKVYAQWEDVKGSGLPSALQARKQRSGYAETQAYYVNNNQYDPKTIDSALRSLKAGDCFSWFSFPGGHSYPFSAQLATAGWFGRWLGLHRAAPVPPLPKVPADEALNIGPLPGEPGR
jgi:hypothetical protein